MRIRPAGGSDRDLNVFARGALEQADEIVVYLRDYGFRRARLKPTKPMSRR